ncbi:MAG TPA: GNAT family N-acetyltransferase [Actinocatenispora sp.]
MTPPPATLAAPTDRGILTLRPADPDADLDLVHAWMHRPHVVPFWQQDWPAERLRGYLADQLAGDTSRPYVGLLAGVPVSYWEIYRPVAEPVGAAYPAVDSDLGVHVLIADAAMTGRRLGRLLLRAVRDALLDKGSDCSRVVAEPDVRNVASVRAFAAAGFRRHADITLPDKTAALMVAEKDVR